MDNPIPLHMTFDEAMRQLPWWALVILFVLMLAQSSFLFFKGRAMGIRWYWALALWGLTTFPLPSLLLWLLIHKKNRVRHPLNQNINEKNENS